LYFLTRQSKFLEHFLEAQKKNVRFQFISLIRTVTNHLSSNDRNFRKCRFLLKILADENMLIHILEAKKSQKSTQNVTKGNMSIDS
jgi:hypothetical protein